MVLWIHITSLIQRKRPSRECQGAMAETLGLVPHYGGNEPGIWTNRACGSWGPFRWRFVVHTMNYGRSRHSLAVPWAPGLWNLPPKSHTQLLAALFGFNGHYLQKSLHLANSPIQFRTTAPRDHHSPLCFCIWRLLGTWAKLSRHRLCAWCQLIVFMGLPASPGLHQVQNSFLRRLNNSPLVDTVHSVSLPVSCFHPLASVAYAVRNIDVQCCSN